MKSKKLTYGLLIIVTALWGLIFYRIYTSVAGDHSSVNNVGYLPQEVAKKTDPVPDDFILIADYRDPFLGTVKATKEPASEEVLQEPISMDLSFLRYIGVITNPKTSKRVTLLNIHGKDHMMEEGMTVEGVKLIRNYKDSIKITFNGIPAFIKQ